MKKLLLIPVLCLMCVGCDNASKNNNNMGKSQESSADWAITTKVKAAIVSDSTLSAMARFVSVSTTDGVVTLTGTVPTQADSDRIVNIVQNVDGVQSVDNQLTVTNS